MRCQGRSHMRTYDKKGLSNTGPGNTARCCTRYREFFKIVISSRVYVSVTNNNGFWIGWLDLLTHYFTASFNYNQLQQLTINGCLWLASFLTGPRVSSTVIDLVLIYVTLSSGLRMTIHWRMTSHLRLNAQWNEWISQELFRVTLRLAVYRLLVRIRGNICWIFVDTETRSVLSWSLWIHFHFFVETSVNFTTLWLKRISAQTCLPIRFLETAYTSRHFCVKKVNV
jgi:hypothetical protein